MTILVTTPNGKVGSEVIRQLVARGEQVRAGAHTVAKAQAAFPSVEVVHFDFDDPATVEAALKGVSKLYLAYGGEEEGPAIRAIDLAKAAGVKRIVHLGAMGAEMADTALRRREQYLEASGLKYTLLRPTWFMQNYATMYAQAVRGGAVAEPAGDGKTSFIDTRDIAAVAVAALLEDGHNGKAYSLTGGEALHRNQVAATISQAAGIDVRYIPLTDEAYLQGVKGYLTDSYAQMLLGIFQSVRAGYTEAVLPTVQEVTGRAPITFGQFAEDHKAVWQPQPVQG